MSFLDLAARRYSVRSYSSRPVEQEKIDLILKAAQLAPTAVNYQPQMIYAVKSDRVHAPIIEEFPVVMECELLEFLHSDHVDGIVGKIVNVKAEESVLDEKGKVDPAKLHALIFDQFRHGYYVTGAQVGKAWNAGAALMKK